MRAHPCAQLAAAQTTDSDIPVACVEWGTTTSAEELRAAVDAWPVPKWCDDHGTNGQWYVNRCRHVG
ncbi:hypothetical protein [Streptomyces capillispiralis]|uniref:Uncharacterized protein n=1 Tax=Streptomyces capillispiralis TaxID=68182 RepID=A0A561TS35_9ACTN|nr:hypothetical protein [Streptomyces capillispiralis]TWF89916.1 hypothetical protein FHX78_116965 [Streptomyces capillispiralis]